MFNFPILKLKRDVSDDKNKEFSDMDEDSNENIMNNDDEITENEVDQKTIFDEVRKLN